MTTIEAGDPREGVSFTLERGEIVALYGPAASTVLESAAAGAGGIRIGTVWRDGGLFPGLTVGEVVDTWGRWTLDPITRREALALTGLTGRDRARFEALTAVERRRLDLALALLGRSDLLFLDEPTAGLAPSGRKEIWTLLHTLAAGGVTILMATRDPMALRHTDRRLSAGLPGRDDARLHAA